MTKFRVLVSETAVKQLLGLEKQIQARLKLGMKELADNPYLSRPRADIKKLRGSNNPELYRLRVGNFRIIYSVINNEVKVTEIIKRSAAYQ